MLYATIHRAAAPDGLALAIRKDLKTVAGYMRWARRTQPPRGPLMLVRIWRSEHPDHVYGKDKLVSVQHI